MQNSSTATPSWIWTDNLPAAQRPRVDRVVFRREFTLPAAPAAAPAPAATPPAFAATLSLSARLYYRLRVNGSDVGSGPARTYPDFREIDAHDIAPYLVHGANQIEAEVLHWNLATFHTLHEAPGFFAQGEIICADGLRISLDTPAEWLCRRRAGVDPTAPRLSFAQGPVEIIDLRRDQDGDQADARAAWQSPAAADPGETPALVPRRLPQMTRIPLAAEAIASAPAAPIKIIGARVTFDGENFDEPMPREKRYAAIAFDIHSDRAQTVPANVWWGEYTLNGVKLPQRASETLPLCNTTELALNTGANKFFATQGLAFGYAEFCIAPAASAAPDASRLTYSNARIAGPFTQAQLDALLASGAPDDPQIAWREITLDATPISPLRHIAWTQPSAPLAPATLPLTIPAAAAPAAAPTLITIDMGKIVLARPVLDIEAPAGTVLDIGFAEEATTAGRARLDKTVVVYGADRITLADGRQTAATFTPRGFRYLDILVSGNTAPVTIHAAGAVEQRYPYEHSGEFECSDPDFNRLWAYGKRTLELCSEDVFTDCPWRERTLYGGDMLAETAVAASLTRDLRLVRQSLEVFLQSLGGDGWLQCRAPSPRDTTQLSEYPLLTAIAAGWYLRLTNDADFARRAHPAFLRMAEKVAASQTPDGIYAAQGRSFIDHGRKTTAGATCAFNAALAATYRAFATTADLAADPAAARAHRDRAAALDAKVTELYFDTTAATYRDLPLGTDPNGTEGAPANTWALLFCDSAQALSPQIETAIASALDHYAPNNEPNSASPYQMMFILSALDRISASALAETAIRKIYAQMLATPTGTLWEHSHSTASLTHAWSAAINYYFATAVLGVGLGFSDPAELKKIKIAPNAETLTHARGKVPHPLGDIEVAWERSATELHLKIKSPKGIPVEIAPRGALAALALKVERAE